MNVTSPPIVYGPHNSCIYCGRVDQLAREHIIPEGLGGNFLFLKASCRDCERRTSRIELECLRRMLGNFRAVTGVRTKRPKARPSRLVLRTSVGDDPPRERVVAVKDYPKILFLMKFERPPILDGLAPSDEVRVAGWTATLEGGRGTLGPDERPVSEWMSINAFLLLLAKIGHAYATAVLSPHEAATYDKLLPQYLLDTTQDSVGHVVGGIMADLPACPGVIHSLHLLRETVGDREYLIVGIRLFAHWGAPQYYAVYGVRVSALS